VVLYIYIKQDYLRGVKIPSFLWYNRDIIYRTLHNKQRRILFMFIAKQGELIVLTDTTRENLEKRAIMMPNITIEETDVDYQLVGGEYVTLEVAVQKEKERVAMLKMTPRDFLLACTQKLGIEWAKLKELMDTNAQVAIELQFCNHVYRGNPLLDQLAGQFGVTSEQLDNLFKTANGEPVALSGADKATESNEEEEV
jgi:hypothetical protein